jgi:hypothetical protein
LRTPTADVHPTARRVATHLTVAQAVAAAHRPAAEVLISP